MSQSEPWRLKVKFWGVRGSTPTPKLDHLEYGGNTSCLEVRAPDLPPFVFDVGSGARELGLALTEEFGPRELALHVLFTHFHWDHIQGIPFFVPFYNPSNSITYYSRTYVVSLQHALAGHMVAPYFPVAFEEMAASKKFVELNTAPVNFGPVCVRPFPLNHPQGATGYRIESGGAVIVYATDREPGDAKLDAVVREFSQDADVLIHDAQYTPEEYVKHKGWGHSTWLEATEVAKDSNVKQLVLFHHDPGHADSKVRDMIEDACLRFPNTVGAREGETLTV